MTKSFKIIRFIFVSYFVICAFLWLGVGASTIKDNPETLNSIISYLPMMIIFLNKVSGAFLIMIFGFVVPIGLWGYFTICFHIPKVSELNKKIQLLENKLKELDVA